MKNIKYTIFFVLAFVMACTQPPDYSDTPEIEFVSFSKTTMVQGFGVSQDFTYLTISFTDGDGDLGTDTMSTVYFDDTRTEGNDFLEYAAPFIPEQGTGNGISGEMTIKVPTTCCIHPDPNLAPDGCDADFQGTGITKDTVVYEVYIIDRAGNKSNVITVEGLTLLCQ